MAAPTRAPRVAKPDQSTQPSPSGRRLPAYLRRLQAASSRFGSGRTPDTIARNRKESATCQPADCRRQVSRVRQTSVRAWSPAAGGRTRGKRISARSLLLRREQSGRTRRAVDTSRRDCLDIQTGRHAHGTPARELRPSTYSKHLAARIAGTARGLAPRPGAGSLPLVSILPRPQRQLPDPSRAIAAASSP